MRACDIRWTPGHPTCDLASDLTRHWLSYGFACLLKKNRYGMRSLLYAECVSRTHTLIQPAYSTRQPLRVLSASWSLSWSPGGALIREVGAYVDRWRPRPPVAAAADWRRTMPPPPQCEGAIPYCAGRTSMEVTWSVPGTSGRSSLHMRPG